MDRGAWWDTVHGIAKNQTWLSDLLLLLFSRSVMPDSLQPHGLQHSQASLSFTISWSLLKSMSIELVMPSNHLLLCHPLFLLPSIFPNTKIFSKWVRSLHQVAKVLELQLQHQSFQWILRIHFLSDWLAVQGTLKSLFQHRSVFMSILSWISFPQGCELLVCSSHPHAVTPRWHRHPLDRWHAWFPREASTQRV